jgi:hypothetical protein
MANLKTSSHLQTWGNSRGASTVEDEMLPNKRRRCIASALGPWTLTSKSFKTPSHSLRQHTLVKNTNFGLDFTHQNGDLTGFTKKNSDFTTKNEVQWIV